MSFFDEKIKSNLATYYNVHKNGKVRVCVSRSGTYKWLKGSSNILDTGAGGEGFSLLDLLALQVTEAKLTLESALDIFRTAIYLNVNTMQKFYCFWSAAHHFLRTKE